MSICTGDYADWSKENCAKMCGYCPAGGDNAVVQGERDVTIIVYSVKVRGVVNVHILQIRGMLTLIFRI